ncbi:MAG TPA: DUF3857 domain-containing protein [Polyangia bacterium]|jgi:hypothetical protein
MAYNELITASVGNIRSGGQRRHRAVARLVAAAAVLYLLPMVRPARAGAEVSAPKALGPWETRFMAAPPAEILAAAAAVKPPADASVVVLFEEMVHTYVDAHRSRHRYRQVYKILTPHGVEGWDRLASGWSPWYEERPALRARVVVPGGRTFTLDPKTIEMSGSSGGDEAVYSDRQLVRAPLPGVAAGAVVEVEIAWEERAPLFEAGTTHRSTLAARRRSRRRGWRSNGPPTCTSSTWSGAWPR